MLGQVKMIRFNSNNLQLPQKFFLRRLRKSNCPNYVRNYFYDTNVNTIIVWWSAADLPLILSI